MIQENSLIWSHNIMPEEREPPLCLMGSVKEQSPSVALAVLPMLLIYGQMGRFDPLEEGVVIVAQPSLKS